MLFWLLLIGMAVTSRDPVIIVFCMVGIILFSGFFYLHDRMNFNIERQVLQSAGDAIILDDNEIRWLKENGAQITLPRKNLKVESPYYAGGIRMFRIWNPLSDSNREIRLTNVMENIEQLINMIEPGLWDQLNREAENADSDSGE